MPKISYNLKKVIVYMKNKTKDNKKTIKIRKKTKKARIITRQKFFSNSRVKLSLGTISSLPDFYFLYN